MITEIYASQIQSNLWILWVTISLLILSLLSFTFLKKPWISVGLLTLTAFSLFSFMALADPYVHIWDESFHAVVSKNLRNHFFLPTLLENPPLEAGTYFNDPFAQTHIWLHKQPLFLWQIALSFKIFGVSLYTLRLPTILMFSILVPIIFRIGSILKNQQVGFYAAVLFLSGSYLLQLSSGRLNTDHNDAAFIFYVTVSFWAWFEYRNSGKAWWIVLIGFFSGAAIMVKWLTGLLVFSGWGLSLILSNEERFRWTAWKHLILSVLVAAVTFLPWQIYILKSFPEIAKATYAMNTLHLKIPVHGHAGDWNYHFDQWNHLVGNYSIWLLAASVILFLFSKIRSDYKIAVVSWILITHVFFLMVPTKMPAFTLIIAPFSAVLFSIFIGQVSGLLKHPKAGFISRFVLSITLLFLYFDFIEIKGKDIYWDHYYKESVHFKELGQMSIPENACFFHFYYNGDIRFQFMSGLNAMAAMPNENQLNSLKDKGIIVYIFDDGSLPAYILNDPEVVKVNAFVWPSKLSQTIEFYR